MSVTVSAHLGFCNTKLSSACTSSPSTDFSSLLRSFLLGPTARVHPPAPPMYYRQSDVWSFGLIVWALYTGSEPYAEINVAEALQYRLAQRSISVPIFNTFSQCVKDLLRQCLDFDYTKRPSFREIVEMLEGPDFDNLCSVGFPDILSHRRDWLAKAVSKRWPPDSVRAEWKKTRAGQKKRDQDKNKQKRGACRLMSKTVFKLLPREKFSGSPLALTLF